MLFDSHIAVLLDASVGLVNALTEGMAGGKPHPAPVGAGRVSAADRVLPPAGRLPPGRSITQTEADYLAEVARRMRVAFEAVSAGDMDQAAGVLNGLLRSTGSRPQLDRVDDDPWQVHFHGADDSLAVGWGAGCATALAFAVGSRLAGRLGVCSAQGCDRVYVDTSRNAARQFCSTACQNRTKTAAFRARRSYS